SASAGRRSIGRYVVTRTVGYRHVVDQRRRCNHGRGHISTGLGWCRCAHEHCCDTVAGGTSPRRGRGVVNPDRPRRGTRPAHRPTVECSLSTCRNSRVGPSRAIDAGSPNPSGPPGLHRRPGLEQAATIHRRYCSQSPDEGSPAGLADGFVYYSSVHCWLVRSRNGHARHHGPVAYRDHFELVGRHRAERANATWQADHTQLDILIVDANHQPVRPWLTVILDDYSRAVCGYMVFVGAPSALNTALALRQGIWPKHHPNWPMCGIPDVLYVDHGPDFTSGHLAQTARDLHFEIIYSTVARPQGR